MKNILLLILLTISFFSISCQMRPVERLSRSQKEALCLYAQEIINKPENQKVLHALDFQKQRIVKETVPTFSFATFPAPKNGEVSVIRRVGPKGSINANGINEPDDYTSTTGHAVVIWRDIDEVRCRMRFSGDLATPEKCLFSFTIIPPKYLGEEPKEIIRREQQK